MHAPIFTDSGISAEFPERNNDKHLACVYLFRWEGWHEPFLQVCVWQDVERPGSLLLLPLTSYQGLQRLEHQTEGISPARRPTFWKLSIWVQKKEEKILVVVPCKMFFSIKKVVYRGFVKTWKVAEWTDYRVWLRKKNGECDKNKNVIKKEYREWYYKKAQCRT